MSDIDGQTLVGLACHLGSHKALELAEYATAINELEEPQRKLLMRGWLAIQHMPNEASLEQSDLMKCLTALRQAWMKIKYTERKT